MCLETKNILTEELRQDLKFNNKIVIDLDFSSDDEANENDKIFPKKLEINFANTLGVF